MDLFGAVLGRKSGATDAAAANLNVARTMDTIGRNLAHGELQAGWEDVKDYMAPYTTFAESAMTPYAKSLADLESGKALSEEAFWESPWAKTFETRWGRGLEDISRAMGQQGLRESGASMKASTRYYKDLLGETRGSFLDEYYRKLQAQQNQFSGGASIASSMGGMRTALGQQLAQLDLDKYAKIGSYHSQLAGLAAQDRQSQLDRLTGTFGTALQLGTLGAMGAFG